MGELPIFASKAHVFTIDPKTKRTWLSLSSGAVDINFFFDPTINHFRVISIEDLDDGKKVIINSTLTEKMNFKKTSQKFGQWTDSNQSTIFGLGFSSEADLDLFVFMFKEYTDSMKKASYVIPTEISISNGDSLNYSVHGKPQVFPKPAPQCLNSNSAKISALESELERVNELYDDLKDRSQCDIKKLKEELDDANTKALSSSVENYKTINDLRSKVVELELENEELKKKLLDKAEGAEQISSSVPSAQFPEIMSLYQGIEEILSQLNNCHSLLGEKIADITKESIFDSTSC